MLCEIFLERCDEICLANVSYQLLKNGCALCICNAIEVSAHRFEVVHIHDDWVCRGKLILAIRPVLSFRVECGPRILEFSRISEGGIRGPLGK